MTWDYGSLCVVCGTITQRGSTDGNPYRHWWCEGKPTPVERATAKRIQNRVVRTILEKPW